jgi:hypothetical protein
MPAEISTLEQHVATIAANFKEPADGETIRDIIKQEINSIKEEIVADIIQETKDIVAITGDSVVDRILPHTATPQITTAIFACVAPCMRILNKIEDCVLAKEFKLKQHNEQIQQCSHELLPQEYLKDLSESLQTGCREVCAPFVEKELEEQRARRLSMIMQLRLALIRHCAGGAKKEAPTKP